MRGHGGSGIKGKIDYIGQLEDDLADFMGAIKPAQPSTLVGFSSGGGFALRFASGARQHVFQRYLLLAPFLSQSAPTARAVAGGWVSVGVPRMVGLSLLNSIGIRLFNDLPVLSHALSDKARSFLTPTYAYNLATNFRPRPDDVGDMRRVKRPCMVIAGTNDEIFLAQQFESTIHASQPEWPVSLIPGVGHTSLIANPQAVSAIVARVQG